MQHLIDTERGAENEQYVDLLNQQGGLYLFTTDASELIAHPYRTLVIDPLTVVYNDLLDKGMEEKGEAPSAYTVRLRDARASSGMMR